MDITAFVQGIALGSLLGAIGLSYVLFKTNILQNWIFAQIVDVMEQLPAILKANPEIMQNLLEPVFAELQKGVQTQSGGNVNIFGMKMPAFVAQMGMQMLSGMFQGQVAKQGGTAAVGAIKDLLGAGV